MFHWVITGEAENRQLGVVGSFKQLRAARSEQGAHLGDGDVVEGGHEVKAEILKAETLNAE